MNDPATTRGTAQDAERDTNRDAERDTERDVVVGTDGTPTAERAVTWAAAEADRRHVALRIVHAAAYPGVPDRFGRSRAAAILARAYTIAHRTRPHVPVRTTTLGQAPAAALVTAAEDAGLLVVGMLSGRPEDSFVASIAGPVSTAARCPVTVVRGHTQPEPDRRPTVVGIENCDADTAVLQLAVDDAERHQAPLVVVHCPPHSGEDPRTTLEERLRPWRDRHPGLSFQVHLAAGSPTDALLDAAAAARHVVVGSHRRGIVPRALLGSTSRALVRFSPCPVTVVGRPIPATAPFDAHTTGHAAHQ